jgi:hypothetical protein
VQKKPKTLTKSITYHAAHEPYQRQTLCSTAGFAAYIALGLMMFLCPHCQQRGVTLFAKTISAPYQPARCSLCGALSTEPMWPIRVAGVVHGVAPFAIVVAALMLWSWWPVVAYIGAALLFHITLVFTLPLKPTTTAAVRSAKRGRWLMGGALLAFVVMLFVAGGWK